MKSLFSASHNNSDKTTIAALPLATLGTILTVGIFVVGAMYANNSSLTPASAKITKPATSLTTDHIVAMPPVAPTANASDTAVNTSSTIVNNNPGDEAVDSANQVTVNGQSITPPVDGSTLTKVTTSPDGSSTTVVSVTGDHQSVTGNAGSTTTTNRTLVRTSTTSRSRVVATDNSP